MSQRTKRAAAVSDACATGPRRGADCLGRDRLLGRQCAARPVLPSAGSIVDGASWQAPAHTKAAPQTVPYALISASGRRVVVPATGGGCTLTAHLTAIETASQVRLRLTGYDDDRPSDHSRRPRCSGSRTRSRSPAASFRWRFPTKSGNDFNF